MNKDAIWIGGVCSYEKGPYEKYLGTLRGFGRAALKYGSSGHGIDNIPATIFNLNGKDMGRARFGTFTRYFDFKDQDSLSIISDPEGICLPNFNDCQSCGSMVFNFTIIQCHL